MMLEKIQFIEAYILQKGQCGFVVRVNVEDSQKLDMTKFLRPQ